MRFIHTADLHLGRILYNERLIGEQEHALEQIAALAKDRRVSALIVAGDVYDRAVPSAEAVQLLDDFVSRLALDLGIHVIMIAGNHDSPARLAFGSRVFSERRLHIVGNLSQAAPIEISDGDTHVVFYPIPFSEPVIVRQLIPDTPIQNYESAMLAAVQYVVGEKPTGKRHVLIAHAFISGCAEAESERPLSIGGQDRISSACVADFDYVALGHLHGPQKAGGDHIHYSGSPLKYSFSECSQRKCVKVVEINGSGGCAVEEIQITPRRELREITGKIDDLLNNPGPGDRDDYIQAVLLDDGPILDAMRKLRRVYPNTLFIKRPGLIPADGAEKTYDFRKPKSDGELFTAFFEQVAARELTTDEIATYERVVEDLRMNERESCDL